MDPLDEYDVRDAFDALDAESVRCSISLDDVYTLYLGLGFLPRIEAQELYQEVYIAFGKSVERLTIEQVLMILSKVRQRREARLIVYMCLRMCVFVNVCECV